MRFLVDAQLPPALARWLSAKSVDARHVADLGLLRAADGALWDLALAEKWVIVTKDEDFATRLHLCAPTALVPAVVWLRCGNLRTRPLLERWTIAWPEVVAALQRGEHLIEIV